MKHILKIPFLFILLIIQSCSDDDCSDIDCFTPPNPFVFELVDKQTGENLFTNGYFNSEDIEIINIDDNTEIGYIFISENDINMIEIISIGWKTEIVECTLNINDSEILSLYVDAKRINGNCCSFTSYEEIRIENTDYEYDDQTTIYRILVD